MTIMSRINMLLDNMPHFRKAAVLFIALLAPLAARADLLAYGGPPNDYDNFLYENSHAAYLVVWFVVCLLFLLGVFGLSLLERNIKRRLGLKCKPFVSMEYVVLFVLCVAVCGLLGILFEASSISWLSRFVDSPKLRAEYDQKCIDYYDTHDWSPRSWENDRVPSIRDGAPEAVTNAYYWRYRYRVHSANTGIGPVTHGGE